MGWCLHLQRLKCTEISQNNKDFGDHHPLQKRHVSVVVKNGSSLGSKPHILVVIKLFFCRNSPRVTVDVRHKMTYVFDTFAQKCTCNAKQLLILLERQGGGSLKCTHISSAAMESHICTRFVYALQLYVHTQAEYAFPVRILRVQALTAVTMCVCAC